MEHAEKTAGTTWFESSAYLKLRWWVGLSLAILACATILAWPAITSVATTNPAYYNGLVASAAISAILTISLNLCMGFGGLLSMMHTGLQMLGGYAVASLSIKLGLHWILGTGVAIVFGAVFSVLVILISLRATYLYFGMITLAANLILIEVGKTAESITGGIVGMAGVYPSFRGEPLSKITFYYIILALLVLVYIVQRNLVHSSVGRSAMAVRESSETASALGIWPSRAKARLFAIAGGMAGLAGALYSLQLGFINPDVGVLENGLIFFVGLFLGGIGSLVGPLLGVAAVALLVEMIKDYARYTTLILGLVLMASMMLIPRGIVGTWKESRFGRDPRPDVDDEPSGVVPEGIPMVPAPEDGVPALEGTALVKHFGGVRAVDGLDIKVAHGTIHGVIGPNGSGKSTLMGCLTRFHELDSGEVRIHGVPAPSAPHDVAIAGVTRVFQVPHLFESISVLDNVLAGMRHRETQYTWVGATIRSSKFRREDRTARAEARALLEFAGLAGRAEWPAGSLSHGQKRLLEVVRAVAARPKVLILDEPATGLTQEELDALSQLCRTLASHGVAVILIEHNIEFVMTLCSTITVIENGKVIAEGDPHEVRNSPAVIEAYLGRPDLVEEYE